MANAEEIDASRKSDEIVAREVMGEEPPEAAEYYEQRKEWVWWEQDRYSDGDYSRGLTEYSWPPPYTTNIVVAWQVLERLRELSKKCVLVEASCNPDEYLCTLGCHYRGQWFETFRASAEAAPLAICRAALGMARYLMGSAK